MATKLCPSCHRELRIAECSNVRPWRCGDFLYAMIGECRGCNSTHSWVIYELPDEVLLTDGELGPTAHERDTREIEAA